MARIQAAIDRIPWRLKRDLRGLRCVVTGGTGMIGRQLCELLKACKAEAITVDINPSADVVADLTDSGAAMSAVSHAQVIFHLAGLKGNPKDTSKHPADYFVPILQMNTNVMAAAKKWGVKHLVYTSSIGAYPASDEPLEEDSLEYKPPMDYWPGWAKRMGEKQLRAYWMQHELNWGCVRLTNTYGPYDSIHENAMFIPSLMAKIRKAKKKPVKLWGNGSEIRDFLFSRDAAEGILRAFRGTHGQYINLGTGLETTIKEVVETMQSIVPFKVEWDGKPVGYSKRVMEVSDAKHVLNWEAKTSLEEGLRDTWEWVQCQ